MEEIFSLKKTEEIELISGKHYDIFIFSFLGKEKELKIERFFTLRYEKLMGIGFIGYTHHMYVKLFSFEFKKTWTKTL